MNDNDCPCGRLKCPRHGNCADCREHHLSRKNAPACDRIRSKEIKKAVRERKKPD